VAPHTSNLDFFVGVLARAFIKEIKDSKFLGKKELFQPPFGWIFRVLGGYPVDRSRKSNLVDAIVEIFDSKERFIIALAPEGTRKYVGKLKTGFYYIAQKANIPIVMVGFDYVKKEVIISQPFYTGKSIKTDMPLIMKFFKGISGKNPKNGLD
jgi:1-acyl-sn-glycerol-3-phosphate acyltransferase